MLKIFSFLLILIILAPNHLVQAKRYRSNKEVRTSSPNFHFVGCAGEKEAFRKVVENFNNAQKAWNEHNLDKLIEFYAPNFTSKDGMNLEKIEENLTDFWSEYTNAKIKSLPGAIYVCGDYATVNLTEITTATGKVENSKIFEYPPQFKASISGITTFRKIAGNWKIVSEEILAEEMWKYYGPIAQELLESGQIKLITPQPVAEKENYISQLKYALPKTVQAVAIIDKILLTEFAEQEDDQEMKAKVQEKKEKEIQAARRTIQGKSQEGLKRLFTANQSGQDELIRAQVELVSFENKVPSLVGIIGISQRVIPKRQPKKDLESNRHNITQTFQEESLDEE